MQHTRADMIRATVKGITLNLRVILEAFEAQGARVASLRVIGGDAHGHTRRQIMANIYGRPILRLAVLEEATSVGAALAGWVGVASSWSSITYQIVLVRCFQRRQRPARKIIGAPPADRASGSCGQRTCL
jgi:sugar (pentulose or hexulose) kinase